MATVRPCIKARMGALTYYDTTLTARELNNTVRTAKEGDRWAEGGIEVRMQREFNMSRVRRALVPYLAQHKHRFFGSLIVLAPVGSLEFEPVEAIVGQLPAAYRESSRDMGFLTISQPEEDQFIALDGQHRLLGFKEVITSNKDLGPEANKVGDDEVAVLFVELDLDDPEGLRIARSLFNNVNRHAKPTTRSDNLITSEDDGYAVITRWLLSEDHDGPLADRGDGGAAMVDPVNWRSNTLSDTSQQLTTMSALYETVIDILGSKGIKWDLKQSPVAPPREDLETAYGVAASFWETLLDRFTIFRDVMADRELAPAWRTDPANRASLILRPVTQVALVRGMVWAMERSGGRLDLNRAIDRANEINWATQPYSDFRETVVRASGRMVVRKEGIDLAAELIAYLIGSEFMKPEQKRSLWENWNEHRGKDLELEGGDTEDAEQGHLVPEALPDPILKP